MALPIIKYCPGTLAPSNAYSRTALKRLFDGRKVNHILPYEASTNNAIIEEAAKWSKRKEALLQSSHVQKAKDQLEQYGNSSV